MKKFSGKLLLHPNFWLVHITGWFMFFLIDSQDTSDVVKLAVSCFVGFCITVAMRYLYRTIYNRFNIYFTLIFISVISMAGGLVWFFLRGIAYLLLFPDQFSSFGEYYHIYLKMMNLASHVTFLTSPLFGWSLLYFGLKYYFTLQDEKVKTEKLISLAQQAQFQMLRYQVNPHFLFNTLNSIKALVRRETMLAETMITELSDFLRYTLRHNGKATIPLREEIEIIGKYLLLEKIRFEKRLNYRFEIDDTTLNIQVLCFLLQPFVENAIKHGMKSSPNGISIIIRSHIRDSALTIEISNTGKWIPETDAGEGIRNVRNRLDAIYPEKHSFLIDKGEDHVSVCIKLEGVA